MVYDAKRQRTLGPALFAERLRLDRPLVLEGLSLRSDKRKLRALDSADGQASWPPRKGIYF
jgi:hypothetical protein